MLDDGRVHLGLLQVQRKGLPDRLGPCLGLLVVLMLLLQADGTRHAALDTGSRDQPFVSLDRRHVALVINSADPLSEAIGRAYQKARSIPPAQVIRVRFPPGQTSLSPARFRSLKAQVDRRTPRHVQLFAIAWPAPYRVGCQSITSAFAFGLDPALCARGCQSTRVNPYYARGDVRRPWDALRIRPAMLLAATSVREATDLFARGVAADGTRRNSRFTNIVLLVEQMYLLAAVSIHCSVACGH